MKTLQKAGTLLLAALAFSFLVACDEGRIDPVGLVDQDELGIVIRPGDVVLAPGKTYRLEAMILRGPDEIRPADVDLRWKSSDLTIIRLLGEGLIEALKPGVAFVEADYRGFTADVRVRVSKEIEEEDNSSRPGMEPQTVGKGGYE